MHIRALLTTILSKQIRLLIKKYFKKLLFQYPKSPENSISYLQEYYHPPRIGFASKQIRLLIEVTL